MDPELAEISGMCTGDGCISVTRRYSEFAISGDMTEEEMYYNNWVMPMLNKKIFLPIIGKKLAAKAYPKTGVYGVITFDKRVVNYLLQLGLKPSPKLKNGVPEQIKLGNSEIKRRFLRGLFDTDGSITFEKNYANKIKKHNRPKILIGGVSKTLMEDCIKICTDLGFKVRVRKPWKGARDKNTNYGFIVQRKHDVERWIMEIGFKSPKHITKINIWKMNGECPPYTTIRQRMEILNTTSPSAKLKTSLGRNPVAAVPA